MYPMVSMFNVVVEQMGARVSHTVAPKEYERYEAMRADWLRNLTFTVSSLNSENTVFGREHINWAFRAWHDACHLMVDADFSRDGEIAAHDLMQAQLFAAWGHHDDVHLWSDMLTIEVLHQLAYYEATGMFVSDQRGFMERHLVDMGWKPGHDFLRASVTHV